MNFGSLLKAGVGLGSMGATGGLSSLALPLGGAAVGAGIGALLNKKDRLGGALGGGLIGGGLGYSAGKKGLLGGMGAGALANRQAGPMAGQFGMMIPEARQQMPKTDPYIDWVKGINGMNLQPSGQDMGFTPELQPQDNIVSDIPTGYDPARASSDPYFQDFLKDPNIIRMLINSGYRGGGG